MNDPGWEIGRDGDELEHCPTGIWADHEQPLLSVVLVLNKPHCVAPRMLDVGVGDVVLPSTFANVRSSTVH